MDHGCDALTTFLFTMSLGSTLKLEGAFWLSIIWFMASINFFYATWEEYQTDVFDLPYFNGVDEGAYIAFGFMIFTGIVGQEFWLNKAIINNTLFLYNELVVGSAFLISLLFSLVNIIKVMKHSSTTNKMEALCNTIIFNYLVFSLFAVVMYANSSLLTNYPKLLIYMYGFCFAKMVVKSILKYRDVCNYHMLQVVNLINLILLLFFLCLQ